MLEFDFQTIQIMQCSALFTRTTDYPFTNNIAGSLESSFKPESIGQGTADEFFRKKNKILRIRTGFRLKL